VLGEGKTQEQILLGVDPSQIIPQQKVSRVFNLLFDFLKGQLLQEIKSDADKLLKIQENKQVVDAVWVKSLTMDRSRIQGHIIDSNPFSATFRIYAKTKFHELKKAACDFWGFKDQAYSLTDEYFNNLSTFQEPILEFYRNQYTPFNPEKHAIVYLFEADSQQTHLNEHQENSITIKVQKNREEAHIMSSSKS
jgi:hypothetical protein